MIENCGKCKFWKQRETHDLNRLADFGKCRRKAPENHVVADRWPTTKMNEWCGEYEEKKT